MRSVRVLIDARAEPALTEEGNFTYESDPETLFGVPGFIYCGDNLEILRIEDYVRSESVDLIYLDPPFNSKRTYNMNYPGSRAQEEAFKDYWSWNESAGTYEMLVERGQAPLRLRNMLRAFRDHLIDEDSDLLAYLAMMSARLVELYRVLKPTGSMYLHCDPTASHYLKLVLDAIFGTGHLVSEVIWKRTSAHNRTRRFGPVHDVILWYAKGAEWVWNPQHTPYDKAYLDRDYRRTEEGTGRRYRVSDLTSNNPGNKELWNGKPPPGGRYWAYAIETLERFEREERIIYSSKGYPQYKRYLDEMPGQLAQDVWTDIQPVNNRSDEHIGYQTQKPSSLLDRIVIASSNAGDTVMDPFCGCGTTVESAERLGRRWVGIDIARKAVEIIEQRFERVGLAAPTVIWHPASPQEAEALAEREPDQFEKWALRRVGAARMRNYDRGIDGEASFRNGKNGVVLVSVKGGKSLSPTMMRDLCWVVEREAKRGVHAIGVLVCKVDPSDGIRREALLQQFLSDSDALGPIPRIQILTIADLFAGRTIRVPGKLITPETTQTTPAAQLLLPLAKTNPPVAKKKKKPA